MDRTDSPDAPETRLEFELWLSKMESHDDYAFDPKTGYYYDIDIQRAWLAWRAAERHFAVSDSAEKDVITLCLRLCLEPADSHSPETREVLERYRPQWEAAAGGKIVASPNRADDKPGPRTKPDCDCLHVSYCPGNTSGLVRCRKDFP